jgi:antitoxin (DNA-binding transcriptional repressor) of toxin-antitoxin stability system
MGQFSRLQCNPRSLVQLCTYPYNLLMRKVSSTDFRKNASTYLDLVEKGAEVDIQRHGKVVARLVPPGTRDEPAWRKPGLKLVTKAPSLSRAIIEDRR